MSSVVMFEFYDGQASLSLAYSTLASEGVVGMAMVIPQNIGEANRATKAELLAYQAAGWDIGYHADSGADLPLLTDDELAFECAVKRTILTSMGFTSDYAGPYGFHCHAREKAALLAVGYTTIRANDADGAVNPPGDRTIQTPITSAHDAISWSVVQAAITAAAAAGNVILGLGFHGVVPSGPGGLEATPTRILACVAAVRAAGMQIVTMSQLMEEGSTMAETPSAIEGELGFGLQSAKGTAATAFYMSKVTRFKWTPDVVTDEGEPEKGGSLDVARAERFGYKGATFEGEARMRPGHLGLLFRGYGMSHTSGGFVFFTGVNDIIRATDDGGGPVSVNILTGTGATLSAGVAYTPTQVCAGLKAVLDGNGTLTQTYTVTYSSTTKKFTIGHAGSTLSLHWSYSSVTKMLADALGYISSADDTGSTSYASDYARDPTGRWVLNTGVNDVIRVTDTGGGPVDINILTGTGAVLSPRIPYNAWTIAAGLKAVLDGNTTLTGDYTILYTLSTNKFTISVASGTLSLHWSHTNSTMEDILGYSNLADDTTLTSYDADYTIWPASRHRFVPYSGSSSFPWLSILDKYDQASTLNSILKDARVNRLTFRGEPDAPVRFTFAGRALYYSDPAGGETETSDSTSLGTPNTDDGSMYFGSASYPVASMNVESSWEEEVVPALCQGTPYSIVPRRRTTGGTLSLYLGSEASAGQFRATYYGSTGGTAPSNTIVERILDVLFESGTAISGVMGAGQSSGIPEYYGIEIRAPECQMMTYGIEQSGDALIKGDLAIHITRESTDWEIVLINNEDRALYQ